jgi:hypothetical protein
MIITRSTLLFDAASIIRIRGFRLPLPPTKVIVVRHFWFVVSLSITASDDQTTSIKKGCAMESQPHLGGTVLVREHRLSGTVDPRALPCLCS